MNEADGEATCLTRHDGCLIKLGKVCRYARFCLGNDI
jgi:hypothetical protein